MNKDCSMASPIIKDDPVEVMSDSSVGKMPSRFGVVIEDDSLLA
jgi:hypothetical protein